MIKVSLKNKIIKNAKSISEFGYNDLVWDRNNLIDLLSELKNDNISILGGDVYLKKNNARIVPTDDSWTCEPEGSETKKQFSQRSIERALEYINLFSVEESEKLLFSLVFDEYFLTSENTITPAIDKAE